MDYRGSQFEAAVERWKAQRDQSVDITAIIDRVIAQCLALERTVGRLVSLRVLRVTLLDADRPHLRAALLQAEREGRVCLRAHDDPATLRDFERTDGFYVGGRGLVSYVVIP